MTTHAFDTAVTDTAAENILDAADRVRSHYNTAVTVPDGWELIHIGQAWSVGPTGTGTHLLVDELWQIPGAIRTFEQQLHRAAGIGAMR